MKFYFAPLEGVTGYIFRNAYNAYFHKIDKYFTPFITTSQKMSLKPKEMRDIFPENNQGLMVVPQILTNNAEQFVDMANALYKMGYNEVNLNLGCPSGTVTAKKKGSGFLEYPEELDKFLENIFSLSQTDISIKTRLGKTDSDEFYRLLEIYNKYPLKELIIHPRVQKDYYKNTPDIKMFSEAVKLSKAELCYNGDIFTVEKYKEFISMFPQIDKVMLGRGLVSNPGLIGEITEDKMMDKEVLKEFYERLYRDYKEVISGEKNVLFKMKEVWSYMIYMFSDYERYAKKIRKSQKLSEYEIIVNNLFIECELVKGAHFLV